MDKKIEILDFSTRIGFYELVRQIRRATENKEIISLSHAWDSDENGPGTWTAIAVIKEKK